MFVCHSVPGPSNVSKQKILTYETNPSSNYSSLVYERKQNNTILNILKNTPKYS